MRTIGFVLLTALFLATTGCMTDASTELVKAPFDATTQLTDGTSKAIGEFLDPLTELTSSTTPGALTDGQLLRAKQKVTVFATHTHENLRVDIARGQGEYLVSLASLAGVPTVNWPEFQSRMSESYQTLFDGEQSPTQSTERIVEAAWASGYGTQVATNR
ncbi:MAG: DUF3015 family protein [Nitrospiraceae bacterium]|nr:DUF3015 family protein [Nitrospiraceae bacterium]